MDKKGQLFVLAALLFMLLPACSLLSPRNEDEAVARVLDTYLYRSELQEAIPEGSKEQDSIVIARGYIDSWIRTQLLLHKAEEALSEEQKDFDKKIEEYRKSLLIYSYRQKLLQQKMDTLIRNAEIEEYYENNQGNFILPADIVKATYVKVNLSAPNISQVRSWIRSGKVEDIDELEKYSINYADKFDTFNNNWVYFSSILEKIPLRIDQPDRFLRYNRNIETSDSLFHYFVHIIDYKLEGDISPVSLITDDIKSILLNKRKLEFYNNLEKTVYDEAANRNHFEIY